MFCKLRIAAHTTAERSRFTSHYNGRGTGQPCHPPTCGAIGFNPVVREQKPIEGRLLPAAAPTPGRPAGNVGVSIRAGRLIIVGAGCWCVIGSGWASEIHARRWRIVGLYVLPAGIIAPIGYTRLIVVSVWRSRWYRIRVVAVLRISAVFAVAAGHCRNALAGDNSGSNDTGQH